MAGPSRTYWRKDQPHVPVERTRINSYGEPETYLEWDLYLVNHDIDQHVMDVDGVCIANPGMDPDYYAQGPEHGYGGPQISDYEPPAPPPTSNPPSTPVLTAAFTTTDDPDVQLDATSTGADTYEFQRDVVSDFSGATTIQDSASNSYTDTSPVADTYYYRVRATNSDGTSAWSATETVTIVLWEPSYLTQLSNHYDASKIESQSTGYDSGTGAITKLYDQNSTNHLSTNLQMVFFGDNINGNTTLRLDNPYTDTNDLDGDGNTGNEFPDLWSPTGYGPYSKGVDSNTGVNDFGFFLVSRPLDSAESTTWVFTQSPTNDNRHSLQFPGNTSGANGRCMAGPIGPPEPISGQVTGNQYNMGLIVPMPSSEMNCMFFENIKSESRHSGRYNFAARGGGTNYTEVTFTIQNKRWRLGRGSSDFGELITFNSKLTTTDITRVEGYLAHKWAMDDRLNASHDYKSSPPTRGISNSSTFPMTLPATLS